ncbi:MAG TPA: hypothetical protein VMA95_20130 [Streptosporangiaceae bacterium]|nr:hypothetical protein [Streptosporangiaceae bacterium]
MALKTAHLKIDRLLLPQKYDDLGVRFEHHAVATLKEGKPPADMVLIRPAGQLLGAEDAVGPEPRWNLLLCGMRIKARDGTDAQGQGQLLITGQRLIGMIDTGTAGGSRLSADSSGSIFCFAFLRDDVYPPQVKKHRLTPSDFSFRSKEQQPVAFQMMVIAAMAYIANDKVGYWFDKNMLHALSDEGREGLLRH